MDNIEHMVNILKKKKEYEEYEEYDDYRVDYVMSFIYKNDYKLYNKINNIFVAEHRVFSGLWVCSLEIDNKSFLFHLKCFFKDDMRIINDINSRFNL